MKSLNTSIIAMTALLLAACTASDTRGQKAPKPFTNFDTLTVEQTACLFNCPAFEVKIFSDGRVLHSGPTFEYTGGPHESRIDRRGLALIAKALRDARLDQMRDGYSDEGDGCEGTMTDMSTLIFRVSRGQGYRDKRVIFYAGCFGPKVPAGRVTALIKAIDQVTGTGALLEQRKQVRGTDGGAAAPPE